MTTRTYSSPEAFKQALEQRLRTSAKSGAEFARKRQLLVFDGALVREVVTAARTPSGAGARGSADWPHALQGARFGAIRAVSPP
jgi:hypothetical protein